MPAWFGIWPRTTNYETDYALIAEHFNSLAELMHMLMRAGRDLIELSYRELQVQPASDDFGKEFLAIFGD